MNPNRLIFTHYNNGTMTEVRTCYFKPDDNIQQLVQELSTQHYSDCVVTMGWHVYSMVKVKP